MSSAAHPTIRGFPPEPRRQTPSERHHEALLAALARKPAAPESSVSLTRNAKGVTQIDVTVRADTPDEAEREAVAIYNRLRVYYPLPSGFNGAENENGGAANG